MKCESDMYLSPITALVPQIKDGEKIDEKVKTLLVQYADQGMGYEPRARDGSTPPDMVDCTQGCGLCVKKADMDYHCFIKCKKFMIECKTCEFQAFPNDPEKAPFASHSCVLTLK